MKKVEKAAAKQENKKKPIVVNRFYITKSVYQLYARATFLHYQKKLRLIMLGFFIAGVIMAAGCYLLWQNAILTILLLLLAFYFLGMFFFGYLFGASREYKELCAKHPESISMATVFYDNHFEIRLNERPSAFRYDQIGDILETADMTILMIRPQGSPQAGSSFGQILLNDSYLIGSAEDVKQLIKKE